MILIGIEDLSLAFMTHNPHLALSTHDAGLALFRQFLEYKAESAGIQVIAVNPAYHLADVQPVRGGKTKILERTGASLSSVV